MPGVPHWVAAAAAFLVLAVAATWPLGRILDRAVADPGDPLLTAWILDWNWWATFRQPLSLFHAAAFHPARYALAFTENLYGIAVVLFPLRLAGVTPLTAQNVAMILGFAMSGLGAYVLGWRLTQSVPAGFAAGVFYMLVPFRFTHLSQIHFAWGGFLPLMLVALLSYAGRPTWKRGALFAALFLANGLTTIHHLLFGALATAVTAVLLLPRTAWRGLIAPMILALLLLAPFLYPYAVVAELYGMQRGAAETAHYSAVPSDWWNDVSEPERRLYPGLLALVCLPLAFLTRQWAKVSLAMLWIAIGFAGSLGMNFVFHQFLFGGVPGFRAIRVPARWAVIAYVGLAITAALVTAALARRNRWIAWIVPAAFAVTLWQAPVRWYLLDPATPAVYGWLAKQNVAAVIELPMDSFTSEYEYLLHATAHHKPIVNGVSGFAPARRLEFSSLARDLDDRFIDALRRDGVDTLIVHGDRYGEGGPKMRAWLQRELDRGRLQYVKHFHTRTSADWVFSLRGAPTASPAAPLPHELEVFLYGAALCVESVAGVHEFPAGGHRFGGEARFAGWAASRYGVRSVDLWFNNRGVRYSAPFRSIVPPQRCPGALPVRWERVFDQRPEGVRRVTDVQVEVTDHRGRTTIFSDRWISWEERR